MIIKSLFIGYMTFGYMRGINHNVYICRKEIKEPYYTTMIFYGIIGIFTYINPIFLPFVIPKEIYRFNAYIKGYDFLLRNDDYYNLLL